MSIGNTFYKIVRAKPDGKLTALFHGTDGTKDLPTGRWLKAQIRPEARDGKGSTTYRSGWHVIDNLPDTLEYIKRFNRPEKLRIVSCRVGHTWSKKHSPARGLRLAEWLHINEVVTLDSNERKNDNG